MHLNSSAWRGSLADAFKFESGNSGLEKKNRLQAVGRANLSSEYVIPSKQYLWYFRFLLSFLKGTLRTFLFKKN